MTDAGPRRSGRKKGPAKVLGKIYTDADSDANEAGGVEPTASTQNDESDDDSEQQKQGRSKRRRQRCMVGQQSNYRAGLLSSAQQGEHPSAIEQHAEAQASIEATESQIVVSPPVQEGKGKSKQRGGLAKVIMAPTKRKKTKYDPAPMKAVAMRAQDFLEPVSQTNIPAAVDPCAALNCRPSAPSSQRAFKDQARKVLEELQQRLQLQEDEGADIDVSALLLPEPGQNCAEGPGAAGEQDRDPEEQLPAAAAGHTAAQPQTSVPASDAVFANHPEQNGMAAVAGPDIVDEQDGDFGDQLAEASKTLQSLDNRLKGRRTGKRLYFRAPPAAEAEAGAMIIPGEDWLSSDEVIITVGILRYNQLSCLQELAVLQRQPLTVLRDLLSCPADSHLSTVGMAVPGAYFYIEGTFYNDTRHPEAIDYSLQIMRFCAEHNLLPPEAPPEASCEASWHSQCFRHQGGGAEQPSGSYRTASMHESCFSDVDNLRIGATGYVYCHQGCCEHALYIKDIRRIHPDDPQQASAYPVQTFQASYRRQKCSICIARYATKITYEDKYAPVTPGFWCSECYEAMHYDARGTLKDNHIVFPLPMTV